MMRESFDAFLEDIESDRESLVSLGRAITVRELREAAQQLLKDTPSIKGCAVALCGLLPHELITALVAFDGHVSSMLLLPASLSEEATSLLVHSAGCEWRFDSLMEQPVRLSEGMGKCTEVQPTTWILATSGTTGTPKLIEHSLETLTRTVKRNVSRASEYTWGLVYDPFRFAGLQVVLQSLLSGSLLCIPSEKDISAQVKYFADSRVNALSATPSLWRKLLMTEGIHHLPLRQITLGGEIADQGVLDALKQAFPQARIIHIYASTEAGAAFAVQDGRAGFPLAWVDGEDAPVHIRISERNHLMLKPAQLPGGEEIHNRIDRDGYLDTQDMVKVEGERVFFLGRASGVINVGGNKVNPEEVENCIREMSDVADVVVFGKKSSMLGQLVVAEVLAAHDGDRTELKKVILQHCRERMENWQVPAMIKFVNTLAENAAGKRERIN